MPDFKKDCNFARTLYRKRPTLTQEMWLLNNEASFEKSILFMNLFYLILQFSSSKQIPLDTAYRPHISLSGFEACRHIN